MRAVIASLALVSFVLIIDVADAASYSGSREMQQGLIRFVVFPFFAWGLIHYFASRKNLPGKWWFSGISAIASPLLPISPFIMFFIVMFQNYRCANCASILREGKNQICEECDHQGSV